MDNKFPLRLTEVDLENVNKVIHLNDHIVSKIREVINEYVREIEFIDSSQDFKDIYINTIRLNNYTQTIYLVLLKHYPTEAVNGRVLFYDNQKKEFANKEMELKLVLYRFFICLTMNRQLTNGNCPKRLFILAN